MKDTTSKTMLGCWGLGGTVGMTRGTYRYSISIERGPFAGRIIPTATEIHTSNFSWRLPPLNRHARDGVDFMPFILYDEVTIDKVAYECLLGRRKSLRNWSPSPESTRVLQSLEKKGSLVVVDYAQNLRNIEIEERINEMIKLDLSDSNIIDPGRASLSLWIRFFQDLLGATDIQVSTFHDMMKGMGGDKSAEEHAFGYLYECSADINRMLILSKILGKPVHEWEDYRQFYKYKFLRVGENQNLRSRSETLSELFKVFIPNFEITSFSQLNKIRDDQRLESVRNIVSKLGDKPINQELALQASYDILKFDKSVKRYSPLMSILGFLSNFLPIPGIGEAVQMGTDVVIDRVKQKSLGWQTFFIDWALQLDQKDVEESIKEEERRL